MTSLAQCGISIGDDVGPVYTAPKLIAMLNILPKNSRVYQFACTDVFNGLIESKHIHMISCRAHKYDVSPSGDPGCFGLVQWQCQLSWMTAGWIWKTTVWVPVDDDPINRPGFGPQHIDAKRFEWFKDSGMDNMNVHLKWKPGPNHLGLAHGFWYDPEQVQL